MDFRILKCTSICYLVTVVRKELVHIIEIAVATINKPAVVSFGAKYAT
ncbi:hypothetical protein [Pedobacter riviphilus]|nr:hypothetical protein [Pedobacter riviphilus]